MTTALEGGEGSASRPGRSLPPGKTRYPSTGGWVGPRAGMDRCGKSHPPPGFDPRTVQPIASRYTDYATRPTNDAVVAQYWAVPDLGYNFIFHVGYAYAIWRWLANLVADAYKRHSYEIIGFVSEVLLSFHRILDECM
jgi:hypothetical protein